LRVEAANKADVRYVAERMRDRDREEFMAVSPFDHHDALVEGIVERYGEHPDVVVAHWQNGPVAVGGIVHHRPKVGTLLFFATDDLPQIGSDLTRFIVKSLFPGYTRAGTHRIECASIAGYEETHRWLSVLGLKKEADMPKYGRDGQDFVQFAWVRGA
jgi:hypothetical protein